MLHAIGQDGKKDFKKHMRDKAQFTAEEEIPDGDYSDYAPPHKDDDDEDDDGSETEVVVVQSAASSKGKKKEKRGTKATEWKSGPKPTRRNPIVSFPPFLSLWPPLTCHIPQNVDEGAVTGEGEGERTQREDEDEGPVTSTVSLSSNPTLRPSLSHLAYSHSTQSLDNQETDVEMDTQEPDKDEDASVSLAPPSLLPGSYSF